MKKVLITLAFVILLTSFASADIILQKQPGDLYNLDDAIQIPVKITSLIGIQDTFHMFVICNGKSEEFYRNDIDLESGQEKGLSPTLRLSKLRVGGLIGSCKIKAELGEGKKNPNTITHLDKKLLKKAERGQKTKVG